MERNWNDVDADEEGIDNLGMDTTWRKLSEWTTFKAGDWHCDKMCMICLELYKIGEELRLLPCAHLYHKDCVDNWLKLSGKCPDCKINVWDLWMQESCLSD